MGGGGGEGAGGQEEPCLEVAMQCTLHTREEPNLRNVSMQCHGPTVL